MKKKFIFLVLILLPMGIGFADDAIAEVVNTWHYGKNEGKVPAEIIVFYAGTVGTPITIKN